MSDSNPGAHDVHEGPIKTPKHLIWTVVASFVVPVVIIIMLTQFVANKERPAAGSDGLGPEATARRIQPIGAIEIRDASAPAVLRTGEQVYQAQCAACHAIGAAVAPQLVDCAAWGARGAPGAPRGARHGRGRRGDGFRAGTRAGNRQGHRLHRAGALNQGVRQAGKVAALFASPETARHPCASRDKPARDPSSG